MQTFFTPQWVALAALDQKEACIAYMVGTKNYTQVIQTVPRYLLD